MKITLTLFVVVSLLLGYNPRTLAENSLGDRFDRPTLPLVLHNRDCKGDNDDDCK
jgi:hypothetical protein